MRAREAYERRRAACDDELDRLSRLHSRVAFLRLGGFALLVVLLFMAPWAALGGALLFAIAVAWHARIGAEMRQRTQLRLWYEGALRRLEGAWEEGAADGGEWLDAEHPHAGELDILGARSLFARLCHAVTASGRERLAQWLLTGASVDEIVARQEAVDELCEALDARESMLRAEPRRRTPPDGLPRWIRLQPEGALGLPLFGGIGLALAMSVSLAMWIVGQWSATPFAAMIVPAYAFARWTAPRFAASVKALDPVRAELRALERLLLLVDTAEFHCERLRRISASLHAEGSRLARRLRELHRLGDWFEASRNPFFAPLAALWMWQTIFGALLERWRRRHGAALMLAVDAVADYEALQSLARHAFENEQHVRPVVDPGAVELTAQSMAHPLLPRAVAVANDLRFDSQLRLYLVSGSNMSGKSTWLRCIGVNVVLAMCGARVRASAMRLPPLAVAASLRASDSLAAGESRFAAELHRLRIVKAAAARETHLLFLLDELFHGTHSHDRREGARALIQGLLGERHFGLVTTHDLALTELAAEWGFARNVHFRDEVHEDRAVFDYRVHDGVVQHSNALRLMKGQGLI